MVEVCGVFGGEWAIKDPMNVVSKGDTVIGNDVWIGNSVTIMQGINVGDGAIIGTNSLVTKDIEPYTIVGGNPAKEIRKRFDKETANFLLKLKWWDWSVEKITKHLSLIVNCDTEGLRKIYEEGKMNLVIEKLSEIRIIGITARTNNYAEMNPETAKITLTNDKFFNEGFQEKMKNRKNPGKIFAVYTRYENDFTGDYTYLIGEEVTSFDNVADGLETIVIPSSSYARLTSRIGKIPDIVIETWQKIWSMKSADLGGKRSYIADFEVYDERSADPQNAVIDVYIGINL